METLRTSLIPDWEVEVVRDEAISAMVRHGRPLPDDPVRLTLILTEEVGEVAAEVLKLTNPTGLGSHRGKKGTLKDLYGELAGVAATSMVWMRRIREEIASENQDD